MIEEMTTVLEPTPMKDFVETPYIKDITERAMIYIKAGFPIHFRGVSGTGKTTLALHIASIINRPVVMIHGDEEFTTSNLVGGEQGYRMRRVVDRFVSRVLKVEEDMNKRWVDNRLTIACKHGFTLLYDEFTRSRPEANNILLSILQERIMDMPVARSGSEPYLKVHPDFTALFTSNPEEYAGVHRSQDALRDRMVTLDVDHFDYETELEIARSKSKIPKKDATAVIKIVRGLRESKKCEFAPTVRGTIMIAKTLKVLELSPFKNIDKFLVICQDVLASETSRVGSKTNQNKIKEVIKDLVLNVTGNLENKSIEQQIGIVMKIKDVRKAVIEFLKEVFDKDAEIIKISKTEEGWTSEGIIYEESSFIKSLGLSTKVQDKHIYIVRLDDSLEVLSYERKKDIEEE